MVAGDGPGDQAAPKVIGIRSRPSPAAKMKVDGKQPPQRRFLIATAR